MAEELLGPSVRDPRRRARPRLPPPRERARAVARARPPFAQIWAHNGLLRVHRREDVEVGRQHRDDPRGARRVGARGAARLLPRRATGASRSTSRARRWRRRRRRPRAFRNVFRGCRASRAATGTRSPPRSTTTSTRRRRSRSCTAGATTSCFAAALGVFGLESLAEQDDGADEIVELAERRVGARAAARLRGGRPAARRDRGRRLGDARRAGGYTLVRKR